MEVVRGDEADKPIAHIAPLEKNEYHKDNDDRRRGQGRQQRPAG